jgi:hypothetical protein
MITSFNAHRDKIKELGRHRFAAESGQRLQTFYSHDTWKSFDNTDRSKNRRIKKAVDPLRSSDEVTMELQKIVRRRSTCHSPPPMLPVPSIST